ncbi:MAG: hypothetical protein ABUL42_02925 [Terricaulis silvestris]
MVQLSDLSARTLDYPNKRVVHVTNDATARLLQREAIGRDPKNTRSLDDYGQLKSEINNNRYNKLVGRHLQGLEAFARTVATAPTAKVDGVTFGLGGLASVNKNNAVAADSSQKIFLFENGIDATGFGRFFSFYSGCEARLMPTIVVAAKGDVGSLLEKLGPLSSKFLFQEQYGQCVPANSVSAPLGISEILSEFAANNFLSVSNAAFSLENTDVSDYENVVHDLAAAYAIIRSVHFEHSKFKSADMLRQAQAMLARTDAMKLGVDQRKVVGALNVLFKLWSLYVYEDDPTQLDAAMSIAQSLGSDILTAHCLRLINLSAGYSQLSIQSLEKAETIFRRNNQDAMALYCRNNLLLNEMHRAGGLTDAFDRLVDEAVDRNKNMLALINMINNGIVAAILDTRYDKAVEFWQIAKKYNASPIHRLGVEVNALICRFMQADEISSDELDGFVRSVTRQNIPPGYAYHQTILLFNIREMQRRLGFTTALTESVLLEKKLMPYEEVLEGDTTLAEFLAKRLSTTLPQGHYSGQRGAFIERTNLMPVVHFGWM